MKQNKCILMSSDILRFLNHNSEYVLFKNDKTAYKLGNHIYISTEDTLTFKIIEVKELILNFLENGTENNS